MPQVAEQNPYFPSPWGCQTVWASIPQSPVWKCGLKSTTHSILYPEAGLFKISVNLRHPSLSLDFKSKTDIVLSGTSSFDC